ncbi:hypothetical protein LTR35_017510 [Friedmanniomyces endolithicus]|uniref:Uncharacterized protein n=1 Tax=Friedmanniomyces endolithicus TaxID=329885 RepID=A0AAN6J0M1_9PEZI|nr:hypothetical protein LTR35_017510 [Friedmanniomyces endolithicus]KAK0270450.1 hypothetical protein LTS00_016953 [Friedmanniomyces endolithicus]KAK0303326.1 hypothetical protein LTR82_017590 [Friedmanniomyces endolithicus]
MNGTSPGYSFVSDSRNHLGGRRERTVKRLAASSEAASLLRVQADKVEVLQKPWRKYRLHPQQFLATLVILIHTDDVPARGVEILPIRCENAPEAPRNVFVHDGAVNNDFLTFVSGLQTQGKLDRVVVDECHVPLTSPSYRSSLVHLDQLRSIPCMIRAFEIRASTDRSNVEYTVETYDDNSLEEAIVRLMQAVRREFEAG